MGTVAAGVSKAHADVVLISGHDGGTGASPLTSLKHAGGPWEIGLAETQQTLVLNNLRDRIVVQVDGQIKTGRDVVVAALLGAEEFGFATAPLVVSGCVMMRVCHLDTCPVGIATQNPELRARFTGKPEFVQTFFEYIAEEVREHLAALGFRTIEEAIGQVSALDASKAIAHWKASGLDLSPIFADVQSPGGAARRNTTIQDHGLEKALDHNLIAIAREAINDGTPVTGQVAVRNVNRTVGTLLGHEVTKAHPGGLPDNTIDLTLVGSAGQSLGAFLPAGSPCACWATRTTTWARVFRAAASSSVQTGRRRSRRSRTSSPATSSATARPPARSSCGARSVSASVCATAAPPRSSRAWATTAAST